MRRRRQSRLAPIAVLLAALSLLVADAALAVAPIAGKTYTGRTTGPVEHGFKPTLRFSVSGNGKQLRAFNWHGACLPLGPTPANAPPGWIDPGFVHPVGKINVDRTGTFVIKNAKQSEDYGPNGSEVTISTIDGHFKTSKSATGTIKYTQRGYTAKGVLLGSCSRKVSFTASTH